MDSNEKFTEPHRLFPGQEVLALCCRNIHQPLELPQGNSPDPSFCMQVPVTSALQDCHPDMKKMAKWWSPQSLEFAFLPIAIPEINRNITQGCERLKNINEARHLSSCQLHLCDYGLHLNKKGIKAFVKVWKKSALGRQSHDHLTSLGTSSLLHGLASFLQQDSPECSPNTQSPSAQTSTRELWAASTAELYCSSVKTSTHSRPSPFLKIRSGTERDQRYAPLPALLMFGPERLIFTHPWFNKLDSKN